MSDDTVEVDAEVQPAEAAPAEEPVVEPEPEVVEVDELPEGPASLGVTADGALTNVAYWHDPEPTEE